MRRLIVALFLLLAVRAEADSNDWTEQHPELCKPTNASRVSQIVKIKTTTRMKEGVGKSEVWVTETRNCSGVLVGKTQVLTALHCMTPNGNTLVLSDSQERVAVFQTPSAEQDLTLLELDSPFDGVDPIQIRPDVPIPLMLVGYGCTDQRTQRSAVMLYTKDHGIGIGGCVCHGDSGGAILDDYDRLVGIMVGTYEDGKHGLGERAAPFLISLGVIEP